MSVQRKIQRRYLHPEGLITQNVKKSEDSSGNVPKKKLIELSETTSVRPSESMLNVRAVPSLTLTTCKSAVWKIPRFCQTNLCAHALTHVSITVSNVEVEEKNKIFFTVSHRSFLA